MDILAADIDVCARCAGGNNAGHTIVVPVPTGNGDEKVKKTFAFHLLPSGEFPSVTVFSYRMLLSGLADCRLRCQSHFIALPVP